MGRINRWIIYIVFQLQKKVFQIDIDFPDFMINNFENNL